MIIKNISKIYRTASVIRATTITTGSETPALPPTLELTNPNYHENNQYHCIGHLGRKNLWYFCSQKKDNNEEPNRDGNGNNNKDNKGDKDNQNKKQSKNKSKDSMKMSFKSFYSSLQNEPKVTQSYIRKNGLKKHMFNSPLLRRMSNLKKMINSVISLNKKYNIYSPYFNSLNGKDSIKWKTRILIAFVLTLAIFLVTFVKNHKKTFKQNLTNELQKINSQQIINGKILEVIKNLRKIYITSYQNTRNYQDEEQHQDQDADKSDSRTNNTQNANRPARKKLIYYKIVLVDKYGKEYVASPYQGDPNNLLKLIQSVQTKNHVERKAVVYYDYKQNYSLYDAFTQTSDLLTPFIPVFITVYFFRKMDPTSILKNLGTGAKQFKIQAIKDIKTKFVDVAGMEQAKKQIVQFVDFLKNNQKYRQMGAKIPKGALLTGPPGTGKTMLARACAGQAGVSFFYISGSQFVELFVGLGASKVRDLFAKARQSAPSIIFIDQIDAIGKKRQNSRNQQKDSTLNQLLVEMDGFSSSQTVVVLAATNRKQILDNALTRPGRFDRMVQINLPDVKARQQIFMVHLAPLKIDPAVEMRVIAKRLSQLSPGFSGADIANLCNEAAIIATRKNRDFITDKDFEQATERITAGYVKKSLMKQKTKKRVAYHQAGHAVASWFLKGGDPLVKLTIIARSKGALGYAQYLPKNSFIMARQQLIDRVAIMLGGITSQQVFFNQMSSGGSDDLQKVYSLTRRMVTQFGMGKDTYNVTLDQQSYVQKQSTFLTNKMQQQISQILQQAKKRSRQIIESKKDIIEALAKQLMLKQTLNKDQILKVMGERPDFEIVKKQLEKAEKIQKQHTVVV